MRETRDRKGRIRIDEKHSLDFVLDKETGDITPIIVKSTNDQEIPNNEPRILFRGRDKLALQMLFYYRGLCEDDGATDFQLQSIDKMIKEFEEFAATSKTMKQPGSTLGK